VGAAAWGQPRGGQLGQRKFLPVNGKFFRTGRRSSLGLGASFLFYSSYIASAARWRAAARLGKSARHRGEGRPLTGKRVPGTKRERLLRRNGAFSEYWHTACIRTGAFMERITCRDLRGAVAAVWQHIGRNSRGPFSRWERACLGEPPQAGSFRSRVRELERESTPGETPSADVSQSPG
jgi:hypothetical protein